jgi:uncharacterized protein YeaO (DUF488 family)
VPDIDWAVVRQMVGDAATRLFQRVAPTDQGSASIAVMFFVSIQDFVDLTVDEVEPDGASKRRLSDSEWVKEISPLDSSFSLMYETLSEQDAFDRMEQELMGMLSDIGNELAKRNFYFPEHVRVSWATKSA